ncbi:hypothetical protein F4802DRAFT_586320 [Xylaria palmicola]|nr:hypothetical protein F4802DRAFT_586320 [Xylaria palmicola]
MASDMQIPEALWQINNGPQLIRILSTVTAITTITVFLRLAVRLRRDIALGPDDWFSILALLAIWGGFPIPILFVNIGGLGRPTVVNVAINPNRLVIDLSRISGSYSKALTYTRSCDLFYLFM